METLISVIGGNSAPGPILREAEMLGKGLAERGLVTVCGGLGGVMTAVCRGAKKAGGTTVGILPGKDPGAANRWIDIPVATGIGYTRNAIVAGAGKVVIALDGKYGTLTEIGFALNLKKPVIGIKTWQVEGLEAVENTQAALSRLDSILSRSSGNK